MATSLAELEATRRSLLQELTGLGDMRRGSISAFRRKCGKASCHCAQPNNPGHGPQYRLTRNVNGKTATETFVSAAAMRKAQREVGEFHRFRELSRDLLAVNEQICQLRPLEETLSPVEKKRPKRSSRKSLKK